MARAFRRDFLDSEGLSVSQTIWGSGVDGEVVWAKGQGPRDSGPTSGLCVSTPRCEIGRRRLSEAMSASLDSECRWAEGTWVI